MGTGFVPSVLCPNPASRLNLRYARTVKQKSILVYGIRNRDGSGYNRKGD